MNINTTEDQIVEGFKNWWNQFGYYLLALLLASVLGLGGMKYWNTTQSNKAKDASASFESVLQFLNKGETGKAKGLIEKINRDYPDLAYSQLARLLEAHIFVTENDYKNAEIILREVIDKKKIKGLSEIATSRLARIYLAQNRAEEAREITSELETSFSGGLLELRADISAAMGEDKKAEDLYEKALKQSELLGYPTSNLILKKNNLSARRAKK